jgi:membrane fusion protein, multidrug efflux system
MRKASIIAGLVLLAATAGGLAYLKKKQNEEAAANKMTGEPPQAVEAVRAREVQWRPMFELVGTVLALRSVTVNTELAGVITRIGFESGSIVEEGAELLALDDATDRADLAQAEASVKVAEANVTVADTRLRLAETELRRIDEAVRLRATSDIELDRAKAELDRQKADRERMVAEIDQAKARVTQVKTTLAKRTIKAPFRARVGLRNIHEGQYLAEGESVVMLQEVSDTINLDFAIPQEYLPRVRPGLTVMATGALLGPNPVPIRVTAVDAAVNNTTRNIRVRTVVDNPNDFLRPGMFVQIQVPVEDPKPYVVVPRTAVRRTSYADQVYLITGTEEKRAKVQFVKVGPTLGDDAIVLEGLKPGDEIAAAGSFKLRDGALVMIAPPKAPEKGPENANASSK